MKKHIGSFLLLTLIVAVIAIRNYTPDTFLTGWDNLHPEFNFALNIKRSLFAVWQEYQGVGLLGGMGHASDLPRQLMLWAASIVIPASLLRYAWTFGMLLLGPLGVYALILSIQHHRITIDNNNAAALLLSTKQWIALSGAIFYLFNLVTVQVFTAPFDAFVTHYGILPWLLWSNGNFLHAPSRRNLLLVTIINVIGMTHAYIPTLFLVYLILLSILSVGMLIRSFQKETITRILSLGLITFCLNAFWLLPFTYFTLTKSSVTVGAKINTMATEEMYLHNKAFGDIKNVATLKSYWYDTADYNPTSNVLEPVLGYWRDLEKNPWVPWVRYTLSAFIFFGSITALAQKGIRVWGALGIVAFGMVAVDTPPFVWMMDWLRLHIPLFAQFFRFPFTKWGIALALFYSVWIGIGLSWLIERMRGKAHKIVPIILVTIPMVLTIIGAIGMLQGQLISPKFKLAIPNEYFQLFAKLKTLPPGRIANLPQNTFWGWTYYRWGYSGSGFLWYGIEQPILDRAFDPWSGFNESYYWEISRSIYSKDIQSLAAVLNKYDVRYVLLDENVISPSHNRALFTEEIKEMLALLPEIKEVARFDNLTLYERTEASQSFVSLKTNLPTVSPAYRWTDNDVAFGELGDYMAKSFTSDVRTSFTSEVYSYPFRSLFTKRSVSEREFRVTETPDAITIGSPIAATAASILKNDTIVYDSTKSADLVPEAVKPCGILHNSPLPPLNVRGGEGELFPDQFLRFTSRNQRGCLSYGVGNLSHRDGYLVAVESRHISGRPLLFSLINQTAKHVELETYLSHNAPRPPLKIRGGEEELPWQTDYFILPPLAPDGLGYTVYLSNDAIGRQETVNDIKSIKFYRMPYDELVTMSSREIASPSARNDSIKVDHPNPAYYKITSATIQQYNDTTIVLSQSFDPGWTAWERIPTFPYVRQLTDHVLVNNWANGWKINNTTIQQNNKTTIVVFFWPQLWEWLGFALLPLPFLFVFRKETKD